jgi:hypothetical protein
LSNTTNLMLIISQVLYKKSKNLGAQSQLAESLENPI